jgi:hypothetical protein
MMRTLNKGIPVSTGEAVLLCEDVVLGEQISDSKSMASLI